MIDFWHVIDQARIGTNPKTPSAAPEALEKVLSTLSTEDVQEFMREFVRKQIELNRWDLWGAGHTIAGGMGDDGFHYFRSWIIGKGRACFEAALKDPVSILPFIDETEVDNEGLEYVALEILEARGVAGDPRDDIGEWADDEPTGEPFDEDTVHHQYPTLANLG